MTRHTGERDGLQNANTPVNPEQVADPSNELRTTTCAVCGGQEITERATLDGLDTVIECVECGFTFFERKA